MRKNFDQELKALHNDLVEMGNMIEASIMKAVKGLTSQDTALAHEVISDDDAIDRKEKQIESRCITLFLQQQPVASDLRVVTAAEKMVTDMERIGDHASDISEIVLLIASSDYVNHMSKISDMANATISMLQKSIEAYILGDQELAKEVQQYDDVVDRLFLEVKSDLTELIRSDMTEGQQAMDLMMIAKYFERIGDHAVNIAEWAEFSKTGIYKGTKMM